MRFVLTVLFTLLAFLVLTARATAQCPGCCPCGCGETGICCCDISNANGDVQKSKLFRARLDMSAYRGPRPMPAGRVAWVEDGIPSWTIIPFPAKNGALVWGPGWFGWPVKKMGVGGVAEHLHSVAALSPPPPLRLTEPPLLQLAAKATSRKVTARVSRKTTAPRMRATVVARPAAPVSFQTFPRGFGGMVGGGCAGGA